ncbi:hypothetical protein [Amycolatopsis japonica]|uniref:hypothetical protein n=1 Tax=Amycolatopsis japonica TaxID=208439 RepID=UPI00380B3601
MQHRGEVAALADFDLFTIDNFADPFPNTFPNGFRQLAPAVLLHLVVPFPNLLAVGVGVLVAVFARCPATVVSVVALDFGSQPKVVVHRETERPNGFSGPDDHLLQVTLGLAAVMGDMVDELSGNALTELGVLAGVEDEGVPSDVNEF